MSPPQKGNCVIFLSRCPAFSVLYRAASPLLFYSAVRDLDFRCHEKVGQIKTEECYNDGKKTAGFLAHFPIFSFSTFFFFLPSLSFLPFLLSFFFFFFFSLPPECLSLSLFFTSESLPPFYLFIPPRVLPPLPLPPPPSLCLLLLLSLPPHVFA
ncbi:unnamed protein product [Acanthosepion pharaonis]|uniref:Uncharacterized protein n=1 Tax=Acanthosepion pharaonis TaxID=158019 RepID=A0A812BYP4_ACAPH|nr:unnamed protein product [Sepia pharaonis]